MVGSETFRPSLIWTTEAQWIRIIINFHCAEKQLMAPRGATRTWMDINIAILHARVLCFGCVTARARVRACGVRTRTPCYVFARYLFVMCAQRAARTFPLLFSNARVYHL